MSGKVYMTADQKSQIEADKAGSLVGSQVSSPSRKVASQKAASQSGSQLSALSSPSRKATGETKVAPLTKSPIPGRLKDVRTPEQRRIDFENHILYHKLNKVTASYSVEQLYREEADRQKWISTSCKYPYVLGPSPNNPGRSPKKSVSPTTRLAPIQDEIDRIKAALGEEEQREQEQAASEVSRLPQDEEEAELNAEGAPPSQPHDEEEVASQAGSQKAASQKATSEKAASQVGSQKAASQKAASKKSAGSPSKTATSPAKPAGTATYTRSPTKRKVTKRYTEEMLATGRPAPFGNGTDEKLPTKCVYRAQRIMQIGQNEPQVYLVEFHSDSVNLDVYAWCIGDEPIPENILSVARRNQPAPADEECAEFLYARELEAKEEERQQQELREQPAQQHEGAEQAPEQQEGDASSQKLEEEQTAEEKEDPVATAFQEAVAALEAIADEEVAYLIKALNRAGGVVDESEEAAPAAAAAQQGEDGPEYAAKAANLTVKVVSASGIRAADSNMFSKDSSDPFATVEIVKADGTVMHADKELVLKTNTIKETLNPEWNVSFDIPLDNDVLFEKDIFARVRVFDYDKTSGDDFLGEAHLTISLPKAKNGATKVEAGAKKTFADVALKSNAAFEKDEATGTITVEITLNTTTDEEIPAEAPKEETSAAAEETSEEPAAEGEEKFVLRDGVASATGLVLSSLAAVAGTDVAEWSTTVDFYGNDVQMLRDAVNQLPSVQGINDDARQLLELCFGEDPLPADETDEQLIASVGDAAGVIEKLRAVARAIYDALQVADEAQQKNEQNNGENNNGQNDSRVGTATSAVGGTATISGRHLDLPAPVRLQLSPMAYSKLKVICLGSHSAMADRLVLLPRFRVKKDEEENSQEQQQQEGEETAPVEEEAAPAADADATEEKDEYAEDFEETASQQKPASVTASQKQQQEQEAAAAEDKPVEYEVDPDAPPRLMMMPSPESPSPYKNSLEMALSSPDTRLERVIDVHAKSKQVGEKQEELYQLRKELTRKTKADAAARKQEEQEALEAAEREAYKQEMARRRQELKEKQAKADEESARRRKEAGLDREKTEEEIAAEEEAEAKRKEEEKEQKRKNKEILERGMQKREAELAAQKKALDDEKRAKEEEERRAEAKRAALMKPRQYEYSAPATTVQQQQHQQYEEEPAQEEEQQVQEEEETNQQQEEENTVEETTVEETVTEEVKEEVVQEVQEQAAKSAKLVVKVVSASGIRAADSNMFSKDSSDPFATVEIVDVEGNLVQVNPERFETHRLDSTLNPEWNVSFDIPLTVNALHDENIFARVRVFDYDKTSGDDFLGEAHLTVALPKTKSGAVKVATGSPVVYADVALKSNAAFEKEEATGTITVEITSITTSDEPAPVVEKKVAPAAATEEPATAAPAEELPVEVAAKKVTCTVKVVSAEGLRAADSSMFSKASSDPYAAVDIITQSEVSLMTTEKGEAVKTKTLDKQLNPEWNETFTFDLKEEALLEKQVYVRARVFDYDKTSGDDFLGEAHFLVDIPKTRDGATKVLKGEVMEYKNVPLMPNMKLEDDKDSQPQGSITLEVTINCSN